jgi:DUF971 family protein
MDAMSAPSAAETPVPERIELGARGRELHLRWPDGLEATLSAPTLRNACRCATCTHLRRRGARAPIEEQFALQQVVQFGIAGLQLVFSDGHRRGIFPWDYLRELAARAD